MATPRQDPAIGAMSWRAGGTDVQYGVAIGVSAPPAADMIEQADRRCTRRQQHGVDVPFIEDVEELVDVLELHGPVIGHVARFAVELGASVDEYRDLPPDQIAAEREI